VFLATKLEALKARMGHNLRTSPDFEDIVLLVYSRSTIVSETTDAESRVQVYVRKGIRSLFRFRNRLGEDLALEALKKYLKRRNRDLSKFARSWRR
jgi:hypothetical protein